MDTLRATLNSPTSMVGTAIRFATVVAAIGAIPPLPPQLRWIQQNFVTQVLLVGTLFYRSGALGDNITMAFIAAAVVIAGFNAMNGKSPLGDMKMPFA